MALDLDEASLGFSNSANHDKPLGKLGKIHGFGSQIYSNYDEGW
jgi:hypothetical protein